MTDHQAVESKDLFHISFDRQLPGRSNAPNDVVAEPNSPRSLPMNAIALLSSDEAELPKVRNIDDFSTYLESIYQSFLGLFVPPHTPDYVTQEILANQAAIQALCNSVLSAVRNYERGLPHLAFQDISVGIQAVQVHFDRLCTPKNVAATPALRELYRIRVEPLGVAFDRPNLYHIPFEMRHRVARQRYSLPGLPCLYLGGTLYIAWEEMGRPAFDSVHYARFRPQAGAQITFLDFGYRPALMGAMIEANQAACGVQSAMADFAVAQAVCWPLLAASSIKKRFPDAPFIAEYIVPQLILQWITNSGHHDGIRYFSVRVDTYMDNPAMPCNYVFPARQFAAEGYCATLRGLFEMSPPLSWQLVERMAMPPGLAAGMPVHGQSNIALVGGHPMQYVNTPFGQIEARSIGYPCATF
jgi:hypothetical protein